MRRCVVRTHSAALRVVLLRGATRCVVVTQGVVCGRRKKEEGRAERRTCAASSHCARWRAELSERQAASTILLSSSSLFLHSPTRNKLKETLSMTNNVKFQFPFQPYPPVVLVRMYFFEVKKGMRYNHPSWKIYTKL